MMKISSKALVLSVWLVIFLPGGQEASAANAIHTGTIVALGDSLTAGYGVSPEQAYPARLEKKLHAAGYQWRVINAGKSGETSSGALLRLDTVLALKPDIVILEIGVNDDSRGMDPAATARNIGEIVGILQANQVTVVLAGMRTLHSRVENQAFAGIYPIIARKYDLILIPFFLQNVARKPVLNQYDGIHPTPEGYRIVTRTVYPYVRKAIKARAKVQVAR